MEVAVTRRGCEVDREALSYEDEARIRRELRVVPQAASMVCPATPFNVFEMTATHYIVPHRWAVAHLRGTLADARTTGATVQTLGFEGALRPEQESLVNAALEHDACVLCAQTGQGKTCMALYLASLYKKKTVVLVHKKFLAEQWKERASQFVPRATVTLYGGGRSLDFSGDIVVATIQTVLSRGVPSAYKDSVGFVVVDEVHRLAAPTFCKVVLRGLNAPKMLGLSATPERADGLERVIYWLCGPLVRDASPPSSSRMDVSVLRPVFSEYRNAPVNRRGDVDFARLLTALAEDDKRTAFLIDQIMQHVGRDRDCLVLSHRRAHCLVLAECLRQRGYDAATYLGGDKIVPTAKVLVATYNLVSEGFDEPRLSALVLSTPASNVVQAVGRILRRPGPKLILDLVDDTPVCWASAKKRNALYISRGYVRPRIPACAFREDSGN